MFTLLSSPCPAGLLKHCPGCPSGETNVLWRGRETVAQCDLRTTTTTTMPGKFRPHSGAVTTEAVSHHSEDLQVFHPCQEISLGHPVAFIQKRDPANAYETAQHMLLSARCTCICMFAERTYCAFVTLYVVLPERLFVGKQRK